jgi:hypothetical protein
MDEATRQEIRRAAGAVLCDAGLTEPPLPVEALLEHLRLYRDYYDLEDPGFLDRAKLKLRIHGRRLVDILNKVRLQAVLLFDENRICIDEGLPKIKHPWASCHEAGHRILPWHRPYFYADTAETLDPAWQEDLEQEAHYAAARLLFLGDCFRADARDTLPTIAGIKALAKRYGASLTATLRRYVADGPDLAMTMLASTPPWDPQPADQPHRWRHFDPSPRFACVFPTVTAEALRQRVDQEASYRRGGAVADFPLRLTDARGEAHDFRGWTFNNTHYLLTLIAEERRIVEVRTSVGSGLAMPRIVRG